MENVKPFVVYFEILNVANKTVQQPSTLEQDRVEPNINITMFIEKS